MSRSRLISFICFLFFLPVFLQAQNYRVWEPLSGVPVRDGRYITFLPQASATVSDENGNMIVSWIEYDYRSSTIMLQKLAANGSRVWEEGIPLNYDNCDAYVGDVQIAYAGNETWWIVWTEQDRPPSEFGVPGCVCVQKVDTNGNSTLSNGTCELIDSDGTLTVLLHHIFPSPDGSLIVVWEISGYGNERAYYAQKLDADAGYLWGDRYGLQLFTTDLYTYTFDACSTPEGGLTYQIARNRPEIVKYQSIDADGNFRWGENPGPDVFLTLETPERCSSVDIVPDGEDGAFLCWVEMNDEIMTKWLDVQRINSDGETCYHPDSLRITEEFGILGDDNIGEDIYIPRGLVPGNPGELLMAYLIQFPDTRMNVYAQKVSGSGTSPVLHWDDYRDGNWDIEQGILLDEAGYRAKSITIFPDRENGFFAYWRYSEIIDREYVYQIHMDHISNDGERLWATENQPALLPDSLNHRYTNPTACLAGIETIHFFNCASFDSVTGQLRVFTVDQDNGVMAGSTHTLLDCISDSAYLPIMAWDAVDHRMWITWTDKRPPHAMSFVQKINYENGQARLCDNGMPIFDYDNPHNYGRRKSRDLILDSLGYAIIISQGYGLWFQKVNEYGELLWGNDGVAMNESQQVYLDGEIIGIQSWDGGFFLAYSVSLGGSQYQPKLQRFTSDGTPAWNNHPQGIELGEPGELKAVTKLQNGSLVAITHLHTGELYATYASPAGEILQSICLKSDTDVDADRVRCLAKRNLLIVTWDDTYYTNDPVWMQVVTEGFEKIWPEYEATGRPFITEGSIRFETGPTADGFLCWLTWYEVDEDGQPTNTILAQRIYDEGEVVPLTPLVLAENAYAYVDYSLVPCRGGDFWCVWPLNPVNLRHHRHINYCHFTPSGLPFDEYYEDTNGLRLTSMQTAYSIMDAVPDGHGGLVVCWQDGRSEISNLYAQRLYDTYTAISSPSEELLPLEWSLSNVYPNPFNPVTRVRFTVANAGKVSLKVYDLLGREVVELANRHYTTGQHSLQWDGSGLASGVYFVRLEADGFTSTRKAVLLK